MTPSPAADRWQQSSEADPWSALSLIISGVLMWGLIGWAVSRWLHSAAFTGAGIVIGGVLGVLCVYLRYGRGQSGPPASGGPVVFHGEPAAGSPENPASHARFAPSTLPAPQLTEEDMP